MSALTLGILPMQNLREITHGESPMISWEKEAIPESHIQMATIDCALGERIYRMKAAAMPAPGESVSQLIEKLSSYEFAIREEGSVLEKGACYLIPLKERLQFAAQFCAGFSPKSSTGRTDTFVRVLCDSKTQYDRIDPGYKGPLYLEVTPLSFNISVTPGLTLTQFRVRSGDATIPNDRLALLHSKYGVLYHNSGESLSQDEIDIFEKSYFLHIDLDRNIVGFESRSNPTETLDLSKKDHYDVDDFWIPIKRPRNGELVLTPGRFYLLTTKERVKIPPPCCAEIIPYDVSSGEYRTHYAGFFDNGFGAERGTSVVLEVRAHNIPQRLYDGQRICRMAFEHTTEIPMKLYGADAGSNYVGSGPSLSKHFRDRESVWDG